MNSLDKLTKARSKLMRNNLGIATMLLTLDLIECDASKTETMATDGRQIFFHPDFVEGHSIPELQAVLIHEAMHVRFSHPLRKGNRHHILWNYATDYVINNHLRYDLEMQLPEGGLWDRKYMNMTAEKVYQQLANSPNDLKKTADNVSNESGDESGDTSGDTSGDESGDASWDDLPMPSGEVLEPVDDVGKPLDATQLEELQTAINRAVSMSDKLDSFGSNQQSGRGDVKTDSDEIAPWHEILQEHMESIRSNDVKNFKRYNKQHAHRGIHMPTRDFVPEGGTLAVAIDSSCSVSQSELNIYASNIQSIAESLNLSKIMICYCDTIVHKNNQGEWWDEHELMEGDDLKLVIRGGGGTEFDPPFNLLNDYTENLSEIMAFVYFTDGYANVRPDLEPDLPVIWCLTAKSSYSDELPFGEKVYIDTSKLY